MLRFPEESPIYLKTGITDMRKSINGLSALVDAGFRSRGIAGKEEYRSPPSDIGNGGWTKRAKSDSSCSSRKLRGERGNGSA